MQTTSCEPNRSTAYDEDLRWRIIYQRYGLELSYRKIGENLNVDPATVCRIVTAFDRTGSVKKAQYPKGQSHYLQKVTDVDKFVLIEAVVEQPGIYLHELQQHLLHETGTQLSLSSICNFLHHNGFTRQKLARVALQRSDRLRSQYLENISIFKADMLVFIDESGSDRRDCLRKYAYSLRGQPAKALTLYNRGRHVSSIAAMSMQGVLEMSFIEGGVCAETFKAFIEEKLISKLRPFNCVNSNSILIMDNASIHHAQDVVQLVESLGVLVYFLPPYSPDYNPIEELFSKIKSVLKSNEHMLHEDMETLLLLAYSSVTVSDCQNWIRHAGYDV